MPNRNQKVIVYPFPMHLSQGFTYHLSILQFIDKLSELIPVTLISLDSHSQLEKIYFETLNLPFPKGLQLISVNNRKFGLRSNALWFTREVRKQIKGLLNKHMSPVVYTRNVKQMTSLLKSYSGDSGVKFIFESHQLFSQNLSMLGKYRDAEIEFCREKILYSRTDKIFTNTVHLSNQIIRLFDKESIVLPVSTDKRNIISALTESEYQGREYDFIYSGSYKEWKGVETVVDALKILKDEGWEKKVLFLGLTESDFKRFSSLIEVEGLSGIVELKGRVPVKDVNSYLRRAKVGLVPNSLQDDSVYNTSPLKVYDYAASGLNIIAARVPALDGVIPNSIVDWFLPDDPISLAECIKASKPKFVMKSLEWAAENTWDTRAKKVTEYILQL